MKDKVLINPAGRSWKGGPYTLIKSLSERYNITKYITLYKYFSVKKEYNIDTSSTVFNINDYLINKSWNESYKVLDELSETLQNTTLICVGTLTDMFGNGKEKKLSEMYAKTRENDEFGTTFNSQFMYLKKGLLIYYLHTIKGIDLEQYIHDPLEPNYTTDKIYYFYKSDRYPHYKYKDFIEYEKFISNDINTNYNDRPYDFTVGMLSYKTKFNTSLRNKLMTELIKQNNENYNLIYSPNEVNKQTYDKIISKSKFTYIFPSIDNEEFSKVRWLESIALGCIPLIDDNCKWKQAFNETEIELIKQYKLISNTNNIKLNNYLSIIKQLQQYYK